MLNREPMGMKRAGRQPRHRASDVSVLNREPMGMKPLVRVQPGRVSRLFQCSTASRWG